MGLDYRTQMKQIGQMIAEDNLINQCYNIYIRKPYLRKPGQSGSPAFYSFCENLAHLVICVLLTPVSYNCE